jgi:hypothetical protein
MMQATLALVGGILGMAAWWTSGDWRWIVGALLILAPWPWTIIAIKPTNDALNAIPVEAADGSSRQLLEKWGRLHAVRTGLGVAAAAAYLWALN